MMVSVAQLVERELAGEIEVLGENLPLCPPQMPHDLTRDRSRAAAVGSRRLTARPTRTVSVAVSQWIFLFVDQPLFVSYPGLF
jgi:hypothetical protein